MSVELDDRGVVPIACECGWDNNGRLVLVDRYATDYPPIPYTGPIVEVYRDDGCDPDDQLTECPACDAELDVETCVERL